MAHRIHIAGLTLPASPSTRRQKCYAPDYADVSYMRPLTGAPLLPDPSALPGNYGSGYPDDYQGSYYGGPYVGYWANGCGLYGYC